MKIGISKFDIQYSMRNSIILTFYILYIGKKKFLIWIKQQFNFITFLYFIITILLWIYSSLFLEYTVLIGQRLINLFLWI